MQKNASEHNMLQRLADYQGLFGLPVETRSQLAQWARKQIKTALSLNTNVDFNIF